MPNEGIIRPGNSGYVVLTIAEYNELIHIVEQVKAAVKVKRWKYNEKDDLEVSIDADWLYMMAIGAAAGKFDFDEYDFKQPDEMYVGTVTLASGKAAPPDEATDAE